MCCKAKNVFWYFRRVAFCEGPIGVDGDDPVLPPNLSLKPRLLSLEEGVADGSLCSVEYINGPSRFFSRLCKIRTDEKRRVRLRDSFTTSLKYKVLEPLRTLCASKYIQPFSCHN